VDSDWEPLPFVQSTELVPYNIQEKYNMLPNLIGIGAQRAATTWMFHCLQEHPEIFTPEVKEIHFFDAKFDEGIEWYEQHFVSSEQRVISEVTPNYLNVEEALYRMVEIVPDAKLFVVLRDPVSRAYSSYRLLYNEHFQGKTFEEACEMTPYMIRLSKYADDLTRAYSLFDSERIAVFLYDDVLSNPIGVVRNLYSFAQVDSNFVPESINVHYNSILLPRLQDLLQKTWLGGTLELFKQSQMGISLKNRLATRQSRRAKSKSGDSHIGSDRFIAKLRMDFRDDIKRVQKIIGRDLTAWL